MERCQAAAIFNPFTAECRGGNTRLEICRQEGPVTIARHSVVGLSPTAIHPSYDGRPQWPVVAMEPHSTLKEETEMQS